MPETPRWTRVAVHWRAVVLALVVVAAWPGLYEVPSFGSRPAVSCALAVLAALVLEGGARRVIAGAALLLAAALVATDAPVGSPLDGGAWTAVLNGVRDGAAALGRGDLPADEPGTGLLLDVILTAVVALVAVLARRGRPGLALGTALVALGYRFTVAPPERPLLTGTVVAAVALVVLARGRPVAGRPIAVAGTAALALGASAVLAADSPLVDWKTWRLSSGRGGGAQAIDFAQRYGQLQWPEVPITVLRVQSDAPRLLRAAVLPQWEGDRFVTDRSPRILELGVSPAGRISLSSPAGVPRITQRVTHVATTTKLLFASGEPVSITSSDLVGRTAVERSGSLQVDPGLERGAGYLVESAYPDPGSQALARIGPPSEPQRLRLPGARGPGGAEGEIVVPPWRPGATPPDPRRFGDYADVARLAQQIARGARSHYEVVARTEQYLLRDFAYDEQPPDPPGGVAPIVDFVRTRRGFCQHFAGTMALMLRMNGVPARVAVGFAAGHFDAVRDDYAIWERDAHSWVEVDFPGYGWLPFNPTPGTGRAAWQRASTSSRTYDGGPVDIPGEDDPVVPEPVSPADPVSPAVGAPQPRPEPVAGVAGSGGSDGPGRWFLALGLLAPLAAPALTTARRQRGRRATDPGTRAKAAGAALRAGLADLRLVPRDVRLTSALPAAVGDDLGLEPTLDRLRRLRFGGRPVTQDDGDAAWQDVDAVLRRARRAAPWRRRIVARLAPVSLLPRRVGAERTRRTVA